MRVSMDKNEENERSDKTLQHPLYNHFMRVYMDRNEENEKSYKTL